MSWKIHFSGCTVSSIFTLCSNLWYWSDIFHLFFTTVALTWSVLYGPQAIFFKSRKVFVFAFLHWSLRKWMTVLHASCWQAVSSIACCLVKWYLEHQGSPTSGPWAWSSLPRLARQSGHKNIILYWGVLTKQNISVSNILGLKRRVIRQYYTTYGCSLWLTNCNKWTSEFFKCCVHAHKTTYSSCAPPPHLRNCDSLKNILVDQDLYLSALVLKHTLCRLNLYVYQCEISNYRK